MSERCPYCESRRVVDINTTATSYEYGCRSCGKQWQKTHTGGQILKVAGTVLLDNF